MKPVCSFPTPRDLCSEIKILAAKKGYKYAQRPYNRFNTDESEWWLIPSDEWPAYRYGKYLFRWGWQKDHASIYSGYYVEKGFGVSLDDPKKIMGSGTPLNK